MLATELTPVTWHSFWTIEGLVALGTLALAIVTAFLAWRTSRMASKTASLAKSTQKLAESTEQVAKLTETDVLLSRTAIEADVRPVLIAVPPGVYVHPLGNYNVVVPGKGTGRSSSDRATVWVQNVDDWLFVSVPVRNEGAGIAFDLSARLEWVGAELPGTIEMEQVPPHEIGRASFGIEPGRLPSFASVAEARSVIVKVGYSDLAGNLWASRLTLEPTSDEMNDWRVADLKVTGEGRLPLPDE